MGDDSFFPVRMDVKQLELAHMEIKKLTLLVKQEREKREEIEMSSQ